MPLEASAPQKYNDTPIPSDRISVKILDKLPRHDTMWDLAIAPDDTLYIGACVEYTAGMSAWLCSYHRKTGKIEYLADMAEVSGEPNDSGHATQGKIHFALCIARDGLVYGATHCTTAPTGDRTWAPFTMYSDPVRCFPGAHFFVHDPRTRQTRSLGALIPREGVRVMVIDAERNLLHGTTYPKCHYFIYDLTKRKLTDLGRFANVHQLALFLDDEGNGYTTDSFGRILKCEAGSHRLRLLDAKLPHAPFRSGEQNIVVAAVRRPGTSLVYGRTFSVNGRLFCFDTRTEKVTDLGLGYGARDRREDFAVSAPGGLTFGKDGWLYYTIREYLPGQSPDRRGHLIRHNPDSGEAQDLGVVAPEGVLFSGGSHHGHTDSVGNIYFTQSSGTPPRFFIYNSGRA